MQIWVDADACPGAIKETLFPAAERERVQVTLVANEHCGFRHRRIFARYKCRLDSTLQTNESLSCSLQRTWLSPPIFR